MDKNVLYKALKSAVQEWLTAMFPEHEIPIESEYDELYTSIGYVTGIRKILKAIDEVEANPFDTKTFVKVIIANPFPFIESRQRFEIEYRAIRRDCTMAKGYFIGIIESVAGETLTFNTGVRYIELNANLIVDLKPIVKETRVPSTYIPDFDARNLLNNS